MATIELDQCQKDAVAKLRNGSILCGGVGSGKSRTALAFYISMYPERDLYIITTARKRDTFEWEEECSPAGIYPVAVDSWNNIKKYTDVTNAFFIFDEQRVVGTGTWVKSFLKIARGSNRWILLSATPGDNWEDYRPVFIANGFYKNITEFNREHVVYSRFTSYPKVDKYINTGRLLRLRNRILVTIDYKRDTVQHHIDLYSDYDAKKYKQVWKTRWNPYTDAPIENASELCYTLRKIVNMEPGRMTLCSNLMEEHHKVIIFYNFDYELEILRDNLGFFDWITIAEWNGHKHEPIPDTEYWAYLVQYTAGAEGWNCTLTDTIIFYSQNYSYKVMVQAAGRIDRRTTPFHDLYYYHLKSHSPIDLGIAKALKEKKKFNELRFINGKE